MKEYVAFDDDAGVVLVEVDESQHDRAMSRVSRRSDGVVVASSKRFDEIAESIRPVADAFMDKIQGLTVRPDTVSIEFGVKVTCSAGAVIASAAGEANFKVSMTWTVGHAD